jgi:uncharacterized protein YjbI with pentapeptide repeats
MTHDNFDPWLRHLAGLVSRWKGHEKELQEIIRLIRINPDWYKSEYYKSVMGALSHKDISDITKVEKDLRGAPLSGVELSDSPGTYSHLSGADLSIANLSEAGLRGADLSGARLYSANLRGADLSSADLSNSDLSFAILKRADLSRADLSQSSLRGADLSGADFFEANLSGTNLMNVSYTTDEVFNRLIKGWIPQVLTHIPFLNRLQNWEPIGITNFLAVDTTKVAGYKNPILKRHMEDCQFIEGFKHKSLFHRWIFYPLWKVTSDCGRSLLLWLIWSLGIIALFAVVYSNHLNWFYPSNVIGFDLFYFSVVTFTTLGFGDIHANLGSHSAQAWVMSEVVIGYVMLGGLVSILANKLARRA